MKEKVGKALTEQEGPKICRDAQKWVVVVFQFDQVNQPLFLGGSALNHSSVLQFLTIAIVF
jgi:hypothetical protein